MAGRLSLIAGSGALVPEVVAAAQRGGLDVQILSLSRRPRTRDTLSVKLDDPDGVVAAIRTFGATMVAMAGGLQLSDADREGLARFLGAPDGAALGDGALSLLAGKLTEMTGARVVGVHEIAPELLAPEGLIAGPEPGLALRDIAAFALTLARKSGHIDLGQGVVVSGRRAIATEDIAGTDALLKRVRNYRLFGIVADSGAPLVLAKAAKPGQPHFVDLPAIGPVTIPRARRAGLGAIAVEAGATVLIQREKLIAAANAARLPVLGLVVANG